MRIPPLTEHSLADVFPIISQVVILRCCSSDGKLLKNTREGWLTGFIFSFSQQLGLIWYCSQSWEQISLVKNQYLAFFTLLILLPSLPLPQPPQLLPLCPVALFPILRTRQQRNLHTVQWKLSLGCIYIAPPTHHQSWPFLSLPWVIGSNLSSLVTCRGLQSSLSSSHLALAFSLRSQLKNSNSNDRGPAGASDWASPSLLPSCAVSWRIVCLLLISTDFPVSNKSSSQRAEPLGPRQSRNSTLSAADIKASFTVKH